MLMTGLTCEEVAVEQQEKLQQEGKSGRHRGVCVWVRR